MTGHEKEFGGIGIFLTEKWIDKVIDVIVVKDSMIVVKKAVWPVFSNHLGSFPPMCF